ncbi:MAG: PAS domain-containing protein [Desulfuromonadales bacterium]|nr:PAS domain-containing protein [Desulfuromonadales bacterium]
MTPDKMSRQDLLKKLEILQLQLKNTEETLQAKASLRPGEERLRLALQASSTGIFEFDLRTGEGRWNDTEFELLGLLPGDVPPGPESFFRYVHPEDLELLARAWDEAKRVGIFDAEFRIIRADGEVRWMAGKGGFTNDGQALIFLGINYDITRQKHAEEALRQSEEIYRSIGESIDYGVWVCTADGRNRYISNSFLRLVGLTQEECSSFGWSKVLHPDDAERTISAWKKCVAAKSVWDIEHRIHGVDGQWHPVLARGVPVLNDHGEVSCWVGINLDIRRLKEAEDTARLSEERLRLALDAAHLATWDWHLPSGTITWNSEHYRMFGYEPDSFIPTYRHWADRIHADDLPATEALIQRAVERAEDYRAEYRVQLPDGTVHTLEALGRFERDSAGNGIRLYGAMIDITERKRLMADLHQTNAELEQSVAERTAELLRTNKLLNQEISERKHAEKERLNLERQIFHAQKLESLGVLAGGIAHDFNNILTAIIGNADLALMRLNPESPAIDNLQKIEAAAARAADLARQMLAYSGKGKFVVENLNLNRLLEEMVHMLEVSISKAVELRFNLASNLPTLEADATQIRQIFMNLIINASEAIGEKNGVITITTGYMECNASYLNNVWQYDNLRGGLYLYVEVTDSGCGMEQETLTKIFDPFFTTKFTGRGLGMAAVLGIVRGHKGAIRIYSEPDIGTTFKVLLPASSQPAAIVKNDACLDNWRSHCTILLVDDEETVRWVGVEMLKELGFTAISANDGLEAVAIFRKTPGIALVILDLTMPNMDGEQCFRELRQIQPDIKIIMSSGYSEQEVAQKFLGEEGLVGFLQKPVSISAMRDTLQALLDID